MFSLTSSRCFRRPSSERGAVIVEAAIAAPVVVLLLLLIFESAFLMRANVSARYGATSGARAGAIAGNIESADYDILASIQRSASALGKNGIIKVVVYKATGTDTPVPPQCLNGPVSGLCNVYTAEDLERAETDFKGTTWHSPTFWAASTRSVSRTTGTDWLGVYVTCDAGPILDFFPSTISNTSVSKLQASLS